MNEIQKLLLTLIALFSGVLMIFWSLFQIREYYRTLKEKRFNLRIHFRLACFILLIGTADFFKAAHTLYVILKVN